MRWFLRIGWLAATAAATTVAACAGGGCTHDSAGRQPQKVELLRTHVVQSFPHDTRAFTQGLEWHDGWMFESTGLNGASSVRRVEVKNGSVQQKTDLPPDLFGEGLTRAGTYLIQLTWKNQ